MTHQRRSSTYRSIKNTKLLRVIVLLSVLSFLRIQQACRVQDSETKVQSTSGQVSASHQEALKKTDCNLDAALRGNWSNCIEFLHWRAKQRGVQLTSSLSEDDLAEAVSGCLIEAHGQERTCTKIVLDCLTSGWANDNFQSIASGGGYTAVQQTCTSHESGKDAGEVYAPQSQPEMWEVFSKTFECPANIAEQIRLWGERKADGGSWTSKCPALWKSEGARKRCATQNFVACCDKCYH